MALDWKKYKFVAVVAVTLLVVTGAVGYYLLTRNQVSTDDAAVDGHIFTITPRVSGYVTQVFVDDNQFVKRGDPLLELDPVPYEVALAQAKATLAQNRATLTSLQLGVPLQLSQTVEQVRGAEARLESLGKTLDQLLQEEHAADQNVKQLQAQYHLATLELERQKALLKSGAVSQQALDNAVSAYDAMQAQLRAAKAKLGAVKEQRASQESEIRSREADVALAATGKEQAEIKARETDAQQAKVALAQAQVKEAELNLSYTTIRSPTNGYVTRKKIEAGQFVSSGQQLFAMVPLDRRDIWITANFKETELTDVRPGQRVDISVDTFPGITLKGKVDSVMAGTGAAFSLFPPENATGNFVKVVQRVPVKITLDEPDGKALPQLRIGMSVIPTIYVR
jgi:membrane fusion protein, multidrug efflux system